MEEKTVKVKIKNIAQPPLKLRLVVDAVRGKSVEEALAVLQLINKKGTKTVKKAILSGVANARELYSVDQDSLEINKISVDEGRTLKKTRFASRARVSTLFKRRSQLNLELKVK